MYLLVTGAWKSTEKELSKLKKLGHEIIFMQNERDELPCLYEKIEGVICNELFLHHPIEKFTSLKYVQLTSAGFDRVPMDFAGAKKIKVCNARGVYSIPMAEFAVSGVLSLYKESRFFYENQKKNVWEKHRNIVELYGKTVCIIGCGSVGSECAKRFSAFDTRVIGVDLYPAENNYFEKIYHLSDIDSCLSESDVVVLTLPLTDETRGMMNKERFSKMKENSVIVNIARGAIIDEKALIEALDTKLFGAVLDVFSEEPLSKTTPLWQKKNVIITPHNSFVGQGNASRLWKVIYRNLESFV